MTASKATVVDVARRANVSIGTVSHVLNGVVQVSEARKASVLMAIKELGYTRNALAHRLRAKDTSVIGICVPQTRLAFFCAVVDAFEAFGSRAGYEVMQVLSPNDPDKEFMRIESLLRYDVGGLVLLPNFISPDSLVKLRATRLPVVIVDRKVPDDLGFDQVSVDNFSAMRLIADRLVKMGHRRLLYILRHRNIIVTRERSAGLQKVVDEFGGAVTAEVIVSGDSMNDLLQNLQSSLRNHPATAIIAGNGILAGWTLEAMRELKIRCPEDVSLVVFDEPEWATVLTPTLSVVSLPAKKIAQKAWELLEKRMAGDGGPPQHIVLPAKVIFRDSVRRIHKKMAKIVKSGGKAADVVFVGGQKGF